MDLFNQDDSGAIFSEDRKYRYVLWRIWNDMRPKVMFIGLNPSTANENSDDPTIRRIKSISNSLGYGGFYMLNLFAWVTAYPDELKKVADPLGDNDMALKLAADKCQSIIFCWGNFKEAQERALQVEMMFPKSLCLLKNKDGSPRHPLYVPGNVKPIPYNQ